MEFGTTLKQLRNEIGLSQIDFANKINVHSQTVSKWERNISLPDFSMIGIIAQNLNVSVDMFFGVQNANSVSGIFDNVKMGEGIRRKRKEKGISQGEFGALVGVGADVVSKWERGLICPDIDRFKIICGHFSVLPSELYYAKFNEKLIENNDNPKKRKIKKRTIIAVISLILVVALVTTSTFLFPKGHVKDKGFSNPVSNPKIFREENVYFCDVHNRFCMLNGGLDFSVEVGENVYAVTEGEITEIIEPNQVQAMGVESIGTEVVIKRADGVETVYWSIILNSGIEVGTKVSKGQEIGKVSNHHRLRCQKNDRWSLHVQVKRGKENLSLKELLQQSE